MSPERFRGLLVGYFQAFLGTTAANSSTFPKEGVGRLFTFHGTRLANFRTKFGDGRGKL